MQIVSTKTNSNETVNNSLSKSNTNSLSISTISNSKQYNIEEIEIEESCESIFCLVNTEINNIYSARINAVIFSNYSYNTNQACNLLNNKFPWIFSTISFNNLARVFRKKFFNLSFFEQIFNDCILIGNFFM